MKDQKKRKKVRSLTMTPKRGRDSLHKPDCSVELPGDSGFWEA